MEEYYEAPKPGFFTRLLDRFRHTEDDDEPSEDVQNPKSSLNMRLVPLPRYHITVRRQVVTFADAISAADGFKRGEQQIINLCSCDAALREKIKDFLIGVNYAQDGTWVELGEHVFLLAPSCAFVETAPPSPRMSAAQN
ncbi:MAG TPA: cell division protein SepF [Fimbriimonadales bacterium]|nr:cell division protein SepF [Fimbriimonadales bacterium]